MSLRTILSLAALIALGLHFTLGALGTPPPNVLLITLDTTRADHLSCYGYDRRTSPNLDALALEGERYDGFIAVSSWTLPAHASLFTGLYPATHGARHDTEGVLSLGSAVDSVRGEDYHAARANALPTGAVTLAEVLRAEGYRTGGVAAGPWLKPIFGLAQGFDWFDGEIDSIVGRSAEEVNTLALPFVKQNRDRPFFLFLNYFDPHAPNRPAPPLCYRFLSGKEDSNTGREYRISQYDAEIFYMDRWIGRLFETLKRLDLYENTLIIVAGDHGELFGEHGLNGHGRTLFEPVVRVPLLVKRPGSPAPFPPNTRFCQQTDIMPFVLDTLGISAPAAMEGQSLDSADHPIACELYRNPAKILAEGARFDRELQAFYAGDCKCVFSTRDGDEDAGLFDLVLDPGEEQDLSKVRPQWYCSFQELRDRWRQSLLQPLAPEKKAPVDERTLEQLRALGYAD